VEAHRVVRRRGFHIFETIGSTDGGEIVSLASRRDKLYPKNIPDTNFFYGLNRPQSYSEAVRIRSIRNAMTLLGIEPATFRLAAQWLNQLC
jgi:hypothetical protein